MPRGVAIRALLRFAAPSAIATSVLLALVTAIVLDRTTPCDAGDILVAMLEGTAFDETTCRASSAMEPRKDEHELMTELGAAAFVLRSVYHFRFLWTMCLSAAGRSPRPANAWFSHAPKYAALYVGAVLAFERAADSFVNDREALTSWRALGFGLLGPFFVVSFATSRLREIRNARRAGAGG